ncbi:MAG: hydantoinase/oxoprolinase family protein [Alphaproteobacteria bacterium]
MKYRIAVDTGGTFTDVVVADAQGRLTLGKALTTPGRSFTGLSASLRDAADNMGIGFEALIAGADVLVYGTTRATNAIVTGRTAKTAFLVTEGFPDILLYRQGGKLNAMQLDIDLPAPYIPRRLTWEIPGRIDAEGGVFAPLDEAAVDRALEEAKRKGIEAIAVCFLWSIVNPAHEIKVGERIEALLPGLPYTLSHQLNPIIREYPRASSTVIDASLKPLMQEHLRTLREDLAAAGFAGELLISTSSGGVMHIDDVIRKPVYMVKSGPAMAPLAGLSYGTLEGLGEDVIVVDTGGTTFDVSLVRQGMVKYTRETWLGPLYTGHNLGMATVDVRSVGAGGGSIAWIDPGGLFRVGPQSAGSEPGPACYGRGGSEPTVTDAAVVLGYIDPSYFLGGRMPLDVEAARRAVGGLAGRLGKPVAETAAAILTIWGESMIAAIQDITVNDGVNPRESLLVAGGGAAGLNILQIARTLGCERALLPSTAGALSACGAQFSDIVSEFSGSRFAHSGEFDMAAVNAMLDDIDARIAGFEDELRARGVTNFQREYFVETRYVGQQFEVEIPLPVRRFASAADVRRLVEVFNVFHERLYAVRDPGSEIECINWKGRLTAHLEKPRLLGAEAARGGAAPKPDRVQRAYFAETGEIETGVFYARSLPVGAEIAGPAVIEEPTTTIVVYPGMRVEVTAHRNYLLFP